MELLDERTVIVMMALTQAILAAIAAGLRLGHPDDVRGIGSWALTMACSAVGNVLVSYHVVFPVGPPPLLPNLFFYTAVALLGVALRRFFGHALHARGWLLFATFGYGLGGLLSVRPEHGAWKVVVFLAMLAVSIALGLKATLASADLRRGVGAKVLLAGLVALAYAVALRATSALRGGDAILLSGTLSAVLPTYLVATHVGLVLVTMGMIVLAAERMRRRLETQANHDVLTGVLTRRGLAHLARRAVARARRERVSVGFLVADIDWFKSVNDQYGHLAGDAVLARVGTAMQEQSREGDLVARFGGEEFAVLLPNADLDQVREAAERMRRHIAATVVRHEGRELQVTMSVGVAALPASAASLDALYSLADSALFKAKASGRNRVEAAEGAA